MERNGEVWRLLRHQGVISLANVVPAQGINTEPRQDINSNSLTHRFLAVVRQDRRSSRGENKGEADADGDGAMYVLPTNLSKTVSFPRARAAARTILIGQRCARQ